MAFQFDQWRPRRWSTRWTWSARCFPTAEILELKQRRGLASTCGRQGSGKQVREVAQLHSVRTSDALHSLQGSTLQQHFDDQPGQHEQGPQGAEGDDAKRAKAQRRTGQGDSREGELPKNVFVFSWTTTRPTSRRTRRRSPRRRRSQHRLRQCRVQKAMSRRSPSHQISHPAAGRNFIKNLLLRPTSTPWTTSQESEQKTGDGTGGRTHGLTGNCLKGTCSGRCGTGACIRRAELGMNEIEDEENRKKLPLLVGQKMMDMIHDLNSDLQNHMADTIYDGKPLVWEMFCQKDSELSKACLREGIPVQRVNLHCGFDVYKDETYDRLWALYKHQRPKKIWVSTMCTLWCDWVDLNYYDRRDVLEKRRRGERQMFKKLVRFLKAIVKYDPDVEIFWEWPHRCRGWKERII